MQIAVQIRHHQTAIKKALLTADELKGVPESCRMYQQIGRGWVARCCWHHMDEAEALRALLACRYFLAPKAELMSELKDLQQERSENVKLLKERHSQMEEAYKSTENELKELLQQNPGLPRAVMNSQQ